MEESNYLQIKAAAIIQRNFRKYLLCKHQRSQQRQCLNKLEILTSNEKCEDGVNGKGIQEAQEILEGFYVEKSKNLNRYKHINDLILSINETLGRLTVLNSLAAFNQTERNVAIDEGILNEAKRRHKEKLKYSNSQWWNKLSL